MVHIKYFMRGSIPLLSIRFIIIMKGVKMKKELDDIEKKIAELKKRKQEILDEEKNRKEEERSKREKEVQDAYEKFIELLKDFEEDYDINISISYDTRSDKPVRFRTW